MPELSLAKLQQADFTGTETFCALKIKKRISKIHSKNLCNSEESDNIQHFTVIF